LIAILVLGAGTTLEHTVGMWGWIALGLAGWLVLSAVGALVVGRFLRVAETEEELVELQRAQRDAAQPPLLT
jgi:hypothetical protein